MITATERAVERLRDGLLRRFTDVGLGYRVAKTGETAQDDGFTIRLDTARPEDEILVLHGIRIIVGPSEAELLRDAELDYSEQPEEGFCLKGRTDTAKA